MWRALSVVGCVLVLSACGGGGGGTPQDTTNNTTNNNTAAAEAAAIQRQSEMGTATLGTARLQ